MNLLDWYRLQQQERQRNEQPRAGSFEGGLLGPFRAQQRRKDAMAEQGWGQAGTAAGAMGGDYGRLFGPTKRQAGLLADTSPARAEYLTGPTIDPDAPAHNGQASAFGQAPRETPSFTGSGEHQRMGGGTAALFGPTPRQQSMLDAVNAPNDISMPSLGEAGKAAGLSKGQRMGLLGMGAALLQQPAQRFPSELNRRPSSAPSGPAPGFMEIVNAYAEPDERKRLAMLRQLGVL